ncbi:MAG: DUF58 domain-containing protein [Planctomycetota bacterium]|jgi:uncharacterized protein (DUF58 family)|nr:DUF58 domain-containing protein [Planctomycetota bacterium]
MILPTPRGAGIFALSLPLSLLIVTCRPGHWPASLCFPATVLALMLADACLMPPRRRLEIKVSAPARLPLGRPGAIGLSVDCPGWEGISPFDAIPELEGEAETPPSRSGTMRRGRLELELPVRPRRRGILAVPAVQLRWRGPLGLVDRLFRHACGLRVEIVPNIRGLHKEALRFVAEDGLPGGKSRNRPGEGGEFDRLRDHHRGMDTRFLDWKRSARHRKLLGKEFRQEQNHQIILGIDAGRLMLEPLDGVPRIDHAIRAALMLGWISLRAGDLVGGCCFGARFRGFIRPGRGPTHFSHLQRFAAGMEYRAEETNFTLGLTELDSRLKRRGLVVLFSEFVDSIAAELLLESLRPLARRHLVVFVTMSDPWLRRLIEAPPGTFRQAAEAVTANAFLRDRAVTLERMARLGAHCLDTPASGLAPALLNRYLTIKQKGLL